MYNYYLRLCFAVFCCTSISLNVTAQDGSTQPGTIKIHRVFDGDTVEGEENGNVYRIRLYGIDAPERGQEFFEESKQLLTYLVKGETLHLTKKGTDKYGRTIAILNRSKDCLNINYEMVRLGLAWHYTRYSTDLNLSKLELAARDRQVGLWSLFHFVEPWEFRKNK